MSFDKATRNLLAKTVTACRRRLTEDVTDQLRGIFGLHPDGTVLALEEMTHLSPDQIAAAGSLRNLLEHYTAGAAGMEKERRKSAYERMTLEISFTILNRLAALRLCEERGLVVECVRKGTTSAGFQMFESISGGAIGGRYETYRVFLECMFDELALDLGLLFDRTTPQSAIFPSEQCLFAEKGSTKGVLVELNKAELSHLWTEDETIGWIYQYFNPPEERKAMRDASQAPQNSRELAVRNQFFTPRYVVEFLTDNTLGRIWYEMRKGDTAIKERCPYMVRRPNEVFLFKDEMAPPDMEAGTDISQEELLKQQVYVEYRPKKDPRDLRVLDPACGSGHFLLYALDLLEQIYEEAWGDTESPQSEKTSRTLREDFETLDDLRREAPKLIMEHNLHGIDIDPRAVQIAALALWLRAQRTWKNIGIRAAERPLVSKSNIVTAEPMPGETDMKEEFTASLKPRVLGQLVDAVFEKMKKASEAGALLKIEEEIKDVVSEAKERWLKDPKLEKQLLFPRMDNPKLKKQKIQFDFTGITDEGFWEQAEERILNALKDYSEGAANGRTIMRRLFVDDAARGFAFIDLCRKRYDVVLMNPPFGECSLNVIDYVAREYRFWTRNILCAFVERSYGLLGAGGQIGAIYDRTANIKSTYEEFRRTWLVNHNNRIISGVDLGWGVLEANVETTCSVLGKNSGSDVFIDVRDKEVDTKQVALLDAIHSLGKGAVTPIARVLKAADFSLLPNAAISPDFPTYLVKAFGRAPSLAEAGYISYSGYTLKAEQHNRMWWEINLHKPPKFFMPMFNGASFEPYTTSLLECVIANCKPENLPSNTTTFIRNRKIMGSQGLCFGKRGEYFCAHIVPSGFLFTQEGRPMPIADQDDAFRLLGFLNTPLFRHDLNTYCGQHKTSGYVNLFPFLESPPSSDGAEKLYKAVNRRMEVERRCETDRRFIAIIIAENVTAAHRVLTNMIQDAIEATERSEAVWEKILEETYEVDENGKLALRHSRDCQPPIGISAPWIENTKAGLVKTWLSYFIGVLFGRFDVRFLTGEQNEPHMHSPFDAVPASPPGLLTDQKGRPLYKAPKQYPINIAKHGILVDDPGLNDNQLHRDDIVRRVREVLNLIWKDKSYEIEQEICDTLGVSELRNYFRKPAKFFQDHVKRYSKGSRGRKAPIYWPLSTSSGTYTIWLYYHRLNDQTLYAAVNQYVEPKISEVERGLARIEDKLKDASGSAATRLRDQLSEVQAFLGELRDLREALLRITMLPYKPDLNDGVIINAAPLHDFFRLSKWSKETKKVWNRLEKGECDWAHMAYTIWPEKVRVACKENRSIAIAHELEAICEVEAPAPKKKRGRGRGKKEDTR